MAKVFIEETTLTAIGDAIRDKTGKTELIDPANMHNEIASIETGGGGTELPEEAFNLTGSFNYRFAEGNWDWFIEEFGDKITTHDVTYLGYAMQNTKVSRIPFTINITNVSHLAQTFNGALNLQEVPKIRGTISFSVSTTFADMVYKCNSVRDFNDLFEPEMLDDYSTVKVTSAYSVPRAIQFGYCYSLRSIPDWWYKFRLNEESTAFPSASYSLYSYLFNMCFVMDEIRNIPVWRCKAAQTSNMLSNSFSNTSRLKALTFETNEGQPVEVQWKSQNLDLRSYVGFGNKVNIINYNGGITEDTQVKNSTTYQALKDNPDWWTDDVNYSRYNHNSAVETINSLPDTSAYLATAGGTNTITFKKSSGSLTDGGAIDTLTAEEIAVAAAKGWTVTLV